MKITDIKTFNVFTYRTNFVFVKIETDEGISGIGEGTLEYKENALLGAIEDIKRVLIGQDPREVERISHELYRDSYWRVGPVPVRRTKPASTRPMIVMNSPMPTLIAVLSEVGTARKTAVRSITRRTISITGSRCPRGP